MLAIIWLIGYIHHLAFSLTEKQIIFKERKNIYWKDLFFSTYSFFVLGAKATWCPIHTNLTTNLKSCFDNLIKAVNTTWNHCGQNIIDCFIVTFDFICNVTACNDYSWVKQLLSLLCDRSIDIYRLCRSYLQSLRLFLPLLVLVFIHI